jgi:hypothetical protein
MSLDYLQICFDTFLSNPELLRFVHFSSLVYIRVAPNEFGARQLARKMWALEMRCYGAIVLFVMARSADITVMRRLEVRLELANNSNDRNLQIDKV